MLILLPRYSQSIKHKWQETSPVMAEDDTMNVTPLEELLGERILNFLLQAARSRLLSCKFPLIGVRPAEVSPHCSPTNAYL
jgi:hypothetical protein